mgnify:CR=1 FL=1
MSIQEKKYYGGCHCKKVQYSFFCPGEVSILVCNCSICEPYSYQHLIINHKRFTLITGQNFLRKYTFETKKAEHIFCTECGIKSYYQPRSHSNSFSINLNCVQNPPIVKKIEEFNGKDFVSAMKNLRVK